MSWSVLYQSPVSAPAVLISRSLPVFTSSGTAANVISSNYNSIWSSTGATATVALDISGVASAQKTTNALYWYDETGVDTTTLYFDVANGTGGAKNNQPTAYTIEANTGAGGGSPPGSGWVTLGTFTNGYASRKHLLSGASSLAAYNWVRMNISASSSSVLSLKLDLWDISGGNRDIFHLGDSRTWFGLNHANPHGGSSSCDSLGNLMQPTLGYYAPTLNTGMSGYHVADLASVVSGWLSVLGAPYAVTLNIGINDSLAAGWTSAWTTSYQSIVNTLISAGVSKVFCESIGYAAAGSTMSTYNSQIASVVSGTPGCYAGYDEFTFYFNNQGLLQGDGVHMGDQGSANVRTAKASFYASVI